MAKYGRMIEKSRLESPDQNRSLWSHKYDHQPATHLHTMLDTAVQYPVGFNFLKEWGDNDDRGPHYPWNEVVSKVLCQRVGQAVLREIKALPRVEMNAQYLVPVRTILQRETESQCARMASCCPEDGPARDLNMVHCVGVNVAFAR